ncbi:NAD-dependent epimerase/dehydratase family protein [Nocardioides sp.]|uniref:NAD-dependent epimerase/dehydratase family protein n=1 Tax=Nocardioides sp. TaxID=35761 RepID=UPI003783E4AB
MSHHVVVGAGPVGRATAAELVRRGHEVVLASRSGTGPEIAGVRRAAADAADADVLTKLVDGAEAVYNCVNPPSYHIWPIYWPPIAEALATTAERTGAVLAVTGNLYPYGPVDVPMTEDLPDAAIGVKGALRAHMWADLERRHREGLLRAVEVRGSDYMGPGVTEAHIPIAAKRAVAGKTARVFGDPSALHSMTDVRDMATALVTVATEPTAWGRVWHAPTNPARSQADTLADVCRAVDRAPVTVRSWPGAMLSVGGIVVPFLREMRETAYQFQRDYVLDSSAITEAFGLTATPWDEVCRATGEVALSA